MTHRALHNEGCPKHLKLEFHTSCSHDLRLSAAALLYVPCESGIFKSMGARSFNSLSDSVTVKQLTVFFFSFV